jgi:hypothetical protein
LLQALADPKERTRKADRPVQIETKMIHSQSAKLLGFKQSGGLNAMNISEPTILRYPKATRFSALKPRRFLIPRLSAPGDVQLNVFDIGETGYGVRNVGEPAGTEATTRTTTVDTPAMRSGNVAPLQNGVSGVRKYPSGLSGLVAVAIFPPRTEQGWPAVGYH